MRAAVGLLAVLAAVRVVGFDDVRAADDHPTRLALVIGEGAYPGARLATAVADAGLMATAFAQAGFAVTAIADADLATLRRTIEDFAAQARAAGPGVAVAVYVSGDGLQYRGENWLVPVGPHLDRDDEIAGAALRLAELTGPLEALPARTRLFLFDLARTTPLAHGGMPLAPGLALVDAPVGSIYAYDTAPGAVALADAPPYGTYARALAEAMQAPGLTLGAMLRRVRLRVTERTNGAAVPFEDGSADPAFAIIPGALVAAGPPPPIVGLAPAAAYSITVAGDTLPGYAAFVAAFPRDPLAGRVRAMAAARREALIWSEAVRANTPRAYWTYLRRYPRGPHFADVRRQLFALHAPLEPPPRFDIVPFEGLPAPGPDEAVLLDHLTFADADGPAIPTPPADLVPAPRRAFYDTLPMSPISPPAVLPLPLPVPLAEGKPPPAGRIGLPGPADSVPLSASLADGPVVTVTKPDGRIVSRLSTSVVDNVRSIVEVAADGKVIAKIAVASSADGAVTLSQVGPGGALLYRLVSREAAAGARETTMTDGEGRLIAAATATAGDIVTASGGAAVRPAPPRFVLMPGLDAKAGPVVVPEPERKPDAIVQATTAETVVDPVAPDKPPPLPSAPGLTGVAPPLNLPPAPPAPAFDSSAKPPALPPEPASNPPSAPVPLPPMPPPAPPAPTAAIPPATPPAPDPSIRWPAKPPLPPSRPATIKEPKAKPRAGH